LHFLSIFYNIGLAERVVEEAERLKKKSSPSTSLRVVPPRWVKRLMSGEQSILLQLDEGYFQSLTRGKE